MIDILAEIRSAIDSFDMERARALLRDALQNPTAETYYLAALAALDDHQKQMFLEKAVHLDPFHPKVATALLSLRQGGAPRTPPPAQQYAPQPDAALPKVMTTKTASLYAEPMSSARVLTTVKYHAVMQAHEERNGFYRVDYEGQIGWMRSDFTDHPLSVPAVSSPQHATPPPQPASSSAPAPQYPIPPPAPVQQYAPPPAQPNMVYATVSRNCKLFTIPHSRGTVRTELSRGAKV